MLALKRPIAAIFKVMAEKAQQEPGNTFLGLNFGGYEKQAFPFSIVWGWELRLF